MADRTSIQLGTVGIGRVWTDATRLRGEGGPADPRLVVPIEIQMLERPDGQQLAMVRLTASLHLNSSPSQSNRIGTPAVHDLFDGVPCASRPNSPTHVEELRFALTPALVQLLENARQAAQPGKFVLYVKLRPSIAWLRKTEGTASSLGLHSDLTWFWTADIDPLGIEIEPSVWIAQVLSGMGYDRVRYVEVHLPQTSASALDVVRFFDTARAELDALRYRTSIGECRSVRYAYEKSLNATREQPFVELLANHVGWHADDARRKALRSVWEGFATLTNSAHHPSTGDEPTAADATFCLFLTAVLADYLERLRRMSVQ